MRIEIDSRQPGRPLGDLFGLFFEDLNHAADGGLYAELVQNRSFEFDPIDRPEYCALTAWEPVGEARLEVRTERPLNVKNPHYLRLIAAKAGGGVRNLGYGAGMSVEAGERCRFSVWARADAPVQLRVELLAEGEALAVGELEVEGAWRPYRLTLIPTRASHAASLALRLTQPGEAELDMVSLFPGTFRGRENGLRRDLAQALCDMRPRFLRFPGGCLTHDGQLDVNARDGLYCWKNTVGPVEERPARRNSWGYNQTFGLGFYEYFQFCEDIGAKPLPVVSGGCDPHHWCFAEGKQLQGFIDDALDLIEFANGAPESEWGGLRARMGHPAPFGLEYLAVGNEEVHQAFFDRFALFAKAIRAKHPKIRLIGTAGPFAAGSEFERGWKAARESGVALVDEHYYQAPEWFLAHMNRYADYPADGPRVLLGEYASWGNDWENALVEAAYMTRLQSAPAVGMACYAPMLAHMDYVNWRPDMLYFDGWRVTKTANYYVQSLFMRYQGANALPLRLCAEAEPEVGMRPIAGELRVQANDSAFALSQIELEGTARPDGVLSGTESMTLGRCEGDFSLALRVKRLSGRKGLKLFFGYEDEQNYYQWAFGGWENQDSLLERRQRGRGSCLTQTAFSVEDGREYDLRLEVRGPVIRTWIDGQPVNEVKERPEKFEPLYAVASVEDGAVLLKAVNVRATELEAEIELTGEARPLQMEIETLQSAALDASNAFGEAERIAPVARVMEAQSPFRYRFPARSVTALRIMPR